MRALSVPEILALPIPEPTLHELFRLLYGSLFAELLPAFFGLPLHCGTYLVDRFLSHGVDIFSIEPNRQALETIFGVSWRFAGRHHGIRIARCKAFFSQLPTGDLYEAAVLETDGSKLPERILIARTAILDRVEESLAHGPPG